MANLRRLDHPLQVTVLLHSPSMCRIFTARRKARIASAVLATAIPSVCLSVRPSVCLSHAGIVSKRRHVARCSLHCQIAKCVEFCRNQKIFPRDDPFPLKSWLQVTYPLLKAASFDILPCSASTVRDRKEVQLHLTRTRHGLSNEPLTKVLRRP